MAVSINALGLDRLSLDERITLAEALWESIAASPEAVSLTDAHKQDLRRRLDANRDNPKAGSTWEEVEVGLTSRPGVSSASGVGLPLRQEAKPALRSSSSRRLSLLDLMILVAATAVAIAWAQVYLAQFDEALWNGGLNATWRNYHRLRAVTPFLVLYSLAVLVCRLRRPRPRLRVLRRQPGLIACCAVLNSLLFQLLILLASLLVSLSLGSWGPFGPKSVWIHFITSPELTGLMVASAWVALGVSGRWRLQASWIDRAGRALGWTLMMLALVEYFMSLIAY